MKKLKLSTGDVFSFAKSGDEWACGQILRCDILQYITIFEPAFRDRSLSKAVKSRVLLCGWTMDAKFYSGDWIVIGNTSPIEFQFPQYKVEIAEQVWVTDVEGEPLELATSAQAQALRFKSSHSPIAFEKAYKAYHGDLPWESWFEELLCPHS